MGFAGDQCERVTFDFLIDGDETANGSIFTIIGSTIGGFIVFIAVCVTIITILVTLFARYKHLKVKKTTKTMTMEQKENEFTSSAVNDAYSN